MQTIVILGQAGSGKDTLASLLAERHRGRAHRVALADPIKRYAARTFDWTEDQLWGPSSRRNEPDMRYSSPNSPMWKLMGQRHNENSLRFVSDTILGPKVSGWMPGETDADWWNTPDWWDTPEYKSLTDAALLLDDVIAGIYHESFKPGFVLTPRKVLQEVGTAWGRELDPLTWIGYLYDLAYDLELDHMSYTPWGGLRSVDEWTHPKAPPLLIVTDARFKNEVEFLKNNLDAKVVRIVDPYAGLVTSGHVSETEQLGISPDLIDYIVVNNKDHGMNRLCQHVDVLFPQLIR